MNMDFTAVFSAFHLDVLHPKHRSFYLTRSALYLMLISSLFSHHDMQDMPAQ